MVMINDPASLPGPMWATVRMFQTPEIEFSRESLQSLLSPPPISGSEGGGLERVNRAIATLQDLGVMTVEGDHYRLTTAAKGLAGSNLESLLNFLRIAVLDSERNAGLADGPDQTGPRDLVRALVWFLSLDPLGPPLSWNEASDLQVGVFAENLGLPIRNSVRWNRFFNWASALGFANRHALFGESRVQALVPDCTEAVRQTVGLLWPIGARVGAPEFIEALAQALPVLPEGRYARELGLPADRDQVSRSLSFALLCGHDQGWISLERQADSQHDLVLVDPDLVNRGRRVTDFEICRSNGG